MFEKLYSEDFISKLKKIPVFVWYLFFGIASAFASLYALYSIGPEYLQIFNESFPELNTDRLLYLFYPMTILLDIVIFELIAYLVYSLIARRFFVELSQFDFVFRLRITMIIIYFIIGLISLIFFIAPQAELITTAIVNTVAQNFFLAYFLFEICKKYVRAGIAQNAYLYLARLYLIIAIVFSLINFVSLFTLDDASLMDYLSFGIRIVLNGLTILLAYYHYNKLKSIPPKEEDEDKKDEKQFVFKDFEF